jgi:hypothetical protein
MDTDLSMMLVTARAASTQQAAAMAIMKKDHEMQMALVDMVAEVARSAPPPGQGRVVDKLA